MSNYNVSIKWSDDAYSIENDGVVTLPDGSTRTIHRIGEPSAVQVKNGPFFTGSSHYLLDTPTGQARFESFDDLMQKGLGLTKS